MEQPPVQHEPLTSLLPSTHNKNRLYFLIGILVLAVCMAGVLSWIQEEGTKEVTQSQNVLKDFESNVVGSITYVKGDYPLLKIVKRETEEPATVKVSQIGSITEGEFKGELVALAEYVFGAEQDSDQQSYGYIYFISDNADNPLA